MGFENRGELQFIVLLCPVRNQYPREEIVAEHIYINHGMAWKQHNYSWSLKSSMETVEKTADHKGAHS